MTLLVTSNNLISQVAAPALPLAPNAYERMYQDQLNSVLRLYFNRLDAILRQLQASGEILPALTVYTVATLPSAATSGTGARSFVSDALAPTFGSTVVGAGTVKTPVYSDGTNWKVG
jgi:hypothetical protein